MRGREEFTYENFYLNKKKLLKIYSVASYFTCKTDVHKDAGRRGSKITKKYRM